MVFNKADHIPERVSQEYADLMGELRLCPQTLGKLFQQVVQVCPLISGLGQKALVKEICNSMSGSYQRLLSAFEQIGKCRDKEE